METLRIVVQIFLAITGVVFAIVVVVFIPNIVYKLRGLNPKEQSKITSEVLSSCIIVEILNIMTLLFFTGGYVLDRAGQDQKRYPEVQLEDLKEADLILLSSEPFPFKEKHIVEIQNICVDQKIIIVDGEAFSWYGSHLAKCGKYYRNLVERID